MNGLPTLSLASLALPPVIAPVDYEVLLADIVVEFKQRWAAARVAQPELPDYDVQLLEYDPAKIVLESAAYIYTLALARVNDASRGLMLATATGADLDHFGADFGLPRQVLTPQGENQPLVMEGDAAYRNRRYLAPEGYAAAGPQDAYRFFALSADPSIKEAVAVKGADNRVDLVLLSRVGDGTVADALVGKVHEALSPRTVRPLTDALYVRSADIVPVTIRVMLSVPYGPDRTAVQQKALAGISAYAGARHAIGQILRLDGISAAARDGNAVEAVDIIEPAGHVDPGRFGAVHVSSIIVEVTA